MSRDIDREVAEKVMGWTYDPDTGMAGTKTLHRVPSTEMADVRLWRPSQSIAAAWEVVEHLASKGYAVRLLDQRPRTGQWDCRFYKFPESVEIAYESHESAFMAICLAALKAVTPAPPPTQGGLT